MDGDPDRAGVISWAAAFVAAMGGPADPRDGQLDDRPRPKLEVRCAWCKDHRPHVKAALGVLVKEAMLPSKPLEWKFARLEYVGRREGPTGMLTDLGALTPKHNALPRPVEGRAGRVRLPAVADPSSAPNVTVKCRSCGRTRTSKWSVLRGRADQASSREVPVLYL